MPRNSTLSYVSVRLHSLLALVGMNLVGITVSLSSPAVAREPAELQGVWDVTRDQSAKHCRISLNSEQSDQGDFFVGVPVACRLMLPALAKIGRWRLKDARHLALTEPGGAVVFDSLADGGAFDSKGPDGASYHFVLVQSTSRSVVGGDAAADFEPHPPKIIQLASPGVTPPAKANVPPKGRATSERPSDLAGRYAILRDKTHDTGCMLTLDDKTRVKGGDRASLAPACRDQGIVVFDPSAWQIVSGRLVLTAKAGHITHLDKQDDGTWLKDPGEGKTLSLKKL